MNPELGELGLEAVEYRTDARGIVVRCLQCVCVLSVPLRVCVSVSLPLPLPLHVGSCALPPPHESALLGSRPGPEIFDSSSAVR